MKLGAQFRVFFAFAESTLLPFGQHFYDGSEWTLPSALQHGASCTWNCKLLDSIGSKRKNIERYCPSHPPGYANTRESKNVNNASAVFLPLANTSPISITRDSVMLGACRQDYHEVISDNLAGDVWHTRHCCPTWRSENTKLGVRESFAKVPWYLAKHGHFWMKQAWSTTTTITTTTTAATFETSEFGASLMA